MNQDTQGLLVPWSQLPASGPVRDTCRLKPSLWRSLQQPERTDTRVMGDPEGGGFSPGTQKDFCHHQVKSRAVRTPGCARGPEAAWEVVLFKLKVHGTSEKMALVMF